MQAVFCTAIFNLDSLIGKYEQHLASALSLQSRLQSSAIKHYDAEARTIGLAAVHADEALLRVAIGLLKLAVILVAITPTPFTAIDSVLRLSRHVMIQNEAVNEAAAAVCAVDRSVAFWLSSQVGLGVGLTILASNFDRVFFNVRQVRSALWTRLTVGRSSHNSSSASVTARSSRCNESATGSSSPRLRPTTARPRLSVPTRWPIERNVKSISRRT